MSKGGGGGGGSYGVGGVGGRSARTGPAGTASATMRRIASAGISAVVAASPTRMGTSGAFQRGHFGEGKSANAVATSRAYYRQGGMPIRISVYGNGRAHVADGNHRISAAKQAGATRIRVDVVRVGARGGERYLARGKVVPI